MIHVVVVRDLGRMLLMRLVYRCVCMDYIVPLIRICVASSLQNHPSTIIHLVYFGQINVIVGVLQRVRSLYSRPGSKQIQCWASLEIPVQVTR